MDIMTEFMRFLITQGINMNSYNYNEQQPVQHRSRRQRKRRSKKKLAGNIMENTLENVNPNNQQPVKNRSRRQRKHRTKKKLADNISSKKGQETKIDEVKGSNQIVQKICANGKNSAGVQEPLKLENKSYPKGSEAPGKTQTLTQNSIKTQVKPAEAVVQTNKKASNKRQRTEELKGVNKRATSVSAIDSKQDKNQLKNLTTLNKSKIVYKPSGIQQDHNKNQFSANDPNTPEFIQSLRKAFHSEIDIMQSRLIAEASLGPAHNDNDLVVAEIHIEYNRRISDELFEFIRAELVGWIGAYQQQGMNTPIFHSITKHNFYLTIVCDNKYAYECVERCVKELLQTKTIGFLKVLALPLITPLIYCFDATYEGIASDSGLFLSQLHLHKPKLYSNDWLVASHKVCSEERRTYFIFLIDERSALALNFYYNQSFYICLQQVTFRSRGIVTKPIPIKNSYY